MEDHKELTVERAVDTYSDMVYRLALTRMGNTVDADDIFQEVFIRLIGSVDKLESEEHLKAWLIRVTENCCKKHFISFWNRNVGGFGQKEGLLEPQGVCKEIDELLEDRGFVTRAVNALPGKYRTVVYLFYYEEMTIKEISDALNMRESTVKSQIFRARQMLRKTLGEVDHE